MADDERAAIILFLEKLSLKKDDRNSWKTIKKSDV